MLGTIHTPPGTPHLAGGPLRQELAAEQRRAQF